MNLAMKRRLWTMQQGDDDGHMARKKWFVFIDTDTFVEWDNLLGLLEHLDATQRIYIGSPVWLPKLQFAHGGSAYALSYGALKALNKPGSHDPNGPLYSQFGVNTTALCCGDEALARALKPKGVNLKGYWPMFNGEIPATLSFGKDLWCEPVISLHHLGGKDMQSLWQWVEDWKVRTKSTVSSPCPYDSGLCLRGRETSSITNPLTKLQQPFLFKDLFGYVAPQIPAVLEDWDNTDESMKIRPKTKASHISVGHCRIACEADKACFQFVYDGATCALSHHIRLGRERAPEGEGERRYISGWSQARIQDWTTKTTCTSARWVKSNP